MNQIYGTNYDLVNHPELLATNIELAVRSAAWYWRYGSSWGDLNTIVNDSSRSDEQNFNRTVKGVRGGSDDARTIVWRNKIVPYVYDQNAYGNMAEVLKALGITSTNKKDYNTQFGITLNKREIQPIVTPNKLLAESSAETTDVPAQTLLEQLQSDFDIPQGETDMLVLAMPDMPPQQAIVIAQAQAKSQIIGALDGTIGVCFPTLNLGTIDPEIDKADGYSLDVSGHALSIFSQGPGMPPSLMLDDEHAQVTVLQSPKHGTLGHLDNAGSLSYYPNPNYAGNDKAIFLADIEGHQVKVVYYFKVVRGKDFSKFADDFNKYCPSPNWWKINLAPADSYSLASNWLNLNQSDITVTFSDLTGSSVGSTEGTTITLDTNAANYGWLKSLGSETQSFFNQGQIQK